MRNCGKQNQLNEETVKKIREALYLPLIVNFPKCELPK